MKPSIIEAQESTILFCCDLTEFQEKLTRIKQKCLEKGLLLQPIIVIIGDRKFNYCLCYYNGIIYKFNSFLKCLDITFKLFRVLNLTYPVEGKHVWYFIESYFYSFETYRSPNLIGLINDLNYL